MYMYMYAFIHMCLCVCMHICALIVSPCISVSACGRCDGCACVFVYICMRYQSHSVTLACVDRDSRQSRLGLTY